MRIGFDAKRYFHNHTGLGNYSRTLVGDLRRQFPDVDAVLYDEKAFTRTFRLGRRAAADGCRLFHGLSNELPYDLPRAGSMRSVVTIHDTAWRTFPAMYHPIDRRIYDIKYGHAARHADCVVAISESTRRDVMRFYDVPAERVRVVYQPLQRMFYSPYEGALPEEASYLLSVGSINSRKNLFSTLKAYARLSAENRPRLLVVGQGRDYERLCRRFVAEQGLERDVVFLGSISSTERLHGLYAGATAMLYPSFYEGFGLPVVEALLSGCPVLTSTVSSLPEAAGPGALYCAPDDIEAMAAQMQRLVDDEALRRRLAREGGDYCRRTFDPVCLTQQMYELYNSLL